MRVVALACVVAHACVGVSVWCRSVVRVGVEDFEHARTHCLHPGAWNTNQPCHCALCTVHPHCALTVHSHSALSLCTHCALTVHSHCALLLCTLTRILRYPLALPAPTRSPLRRRQRKARTRRWRETKMPVPATRTARPPQQRAAAVVPLRLWWSLPQPHGIRSSGKR
eukprot:364628-Chlamydomonas_euryale.AAC.6